MPIYDGLSAQDAKLVDDAAAALAADLPEHRHHGQQFVMENLTPDEARQIVAIGETSAPNKTERREQVKRVLAKAYDRRQAEALKEVEREKAEKAAARAQEPAGEEVATDRTEGHGTEEGEQIVAMTPCDVSGDEPTEVEG